MSQKKFPDSTLVLDLDECLISAMIRDEDVSGEEKIRELMLPHNVALRSRFMALKILCEGATEEFSLWAIKRPYLDEFLCFADRYFEKIIVWSAADPDYVRKFAAELFKDHRSPDLVLTRADVVYTDSTGRDYHKPLSVIQERYPGLVDLTKTFFLDDKNDNFRHNMDNGLNIPPYTPILGGNGVRDEEGVFHVEDRCLLSLMEWLMSDEVLKTSDIRRVDKSDVFTREFSGLHQHLCSQDHRLVCAPARYRYNKVKTHT